MQFISDEGEDLSWGVFLSFNRKTVRKRGPSREEKVTYTIDVLLNLARNCDKSGLLKSPVHERDGEMKIVTLQLSNIVKISSIRIMVPQDLKTYDCRQSVKKSLRSVFSSFQDKVPLLDPIEDMKIKDKDFRSLVSKMESDEKRLREFSNIDSKSIEQYTIKEKLLDKMKKVKAELRKAQSLLQMDELKCRKRVLRSLGYCTVSDVIEIKGRVACEITR